MRLDEVVERLRRARRKSEVISALMDTLGAFIGADGVGAYEVGSSGRMALEWRGIDDAAVSRYQSCVGSRVFSDPLLRAALEQTQAVADQSVATNADWRSLYNEAARPFGYRHVAIAPVVMFDGEVVALSCLRTRRARSFSRRELSRLMSVSLWSSSALSRLGGGGAELLTARQREVGELVLRGLTNAEIASVLCISPNTVKKYLKEIFLRHGISRRAELAALLR